MFQPNVTFVPTCHDLRRTLETVASDTIPPISNAILSRCRALALSRAPQRRSRAQRRPAWLLNAGVGDLQGSQNAGTDIGPQIPAPILSHQLPAQLMLAADGVVKRPRRGLDCKLNSIATHETPRLYLPLEHAKHNSFGVEYGFSARVLLSRAS